jgi:mannose-6-phosphate isomerase-like protein (cupin superfamily)
MIEGKPDVELKPGVAIQVPPGVPHDIKVAAGKPLKLLGIYIVEKDKPVATPAPK